VVFDQCLFSFKNRLASSGKGRLGHLGRIPISSSMIAFSTSGLSILATLWSLVFKLRHLRLLLHLTAMYHVPLFLYSDAISCNGAKAVWKFYIWATNRYISVGGSPAKRVTGKPCSRVRIPPSPQVLSRHKNPA